MAGWEWPLRYTQALGLTLVQLLWLAGNGRFDILEDVNASWAYELWLAGNGRFDILPHNALHAEIELWLAGNGRFDILGRK